jgi:hypothetical protein
MNKYLFSVFHVLGIILDLRCREVKKSVSAYILVGKTVHCFKFTAIAM